MQRARRHNPYPLTWEIPLAIACAVLLTLALGVHVGNGLAHLAAGEAWVWPQQQDLFAAVPTLLASSDGIGGVRAWILSVELLLIAALGWLTVTGLRWWGPSRLKGMATPDQAEQVLGVRRLRKVAAIVRPDLHGRTPREVRR